MKIKNIKVGIKSLQQGLKEFAQTIKSIQQGRPSRKAKKGVYFTSVEAMRRVLTPKRLELLHTIRKKQPDSVYGLARMSHRDLKNVQEDVTLLSRIGLVSLNKTRTARERVIPKVDYDSLQLQIPVI